MEDAMKKWEDHEDRIRILEKSNAEMKFNLLSIEKGQSDLKLLVSESNKQLGENNRQLSELLNKFVDSELDGKKTNQTNIWNLIFKVWVILAPIGAAIAGYISKG